MVSRVAEDPDANEHHGSNCPAQRVGVRWCEARRSVGQLGMRAVASSWIHTSSPSSVLRTAGSVSRTAERDRSQDSRLCTRPTESGRTPVNRLARGSRSPAAVRRPTADRPRGGRARPGRTAAAVPSAGAGARRRRPRPPGAQLVAGDAPAQRAPRVVCARSASSALKARGFDSSPYGGRMAHQELGFDDEGLQAPGAEVRERSLRSELRVRVQIAPERGVADRPVVERNDALVSVCGQIRDG